MVSYIKLSGKHLEPTFFKVKTEYHIDDICIIYTCNTTVPS